MGVTVWANMPEREVARPSERHLSRKIWQQLFRLFTISVQSLRYDTIIQRLSGTDGCSPSWFSDGESDCSAAASWAPPLALLSSARPIAGNWHFFDLFKTNRVVAASWGVSETFLVREMW
jgi:hypothetical protein